MDCVAQCPPASRRACASRRVARALLSVPHPQQAVRLAQRVGAQLHGARNPCGFALARAGACSAPLASKRKPCHGQAISPFSTGPSDQRGTAVRAGVVGGDRLAVGVSPEHEVLAEAAQAHRGPAQLRGLEDRIPAVGDHGGLQCISTDGSDFRPSSRICRGMAACRPSCDPSVVARNGRKPLRFGFPTRAPAGARPAGRLPERRPRRGPGRRALRGRPAAHRGDAGSGLRRAAAGRRRTGHPHGAAHRRHGPGLRGPDRRRCARPRAARRSTSSSGSSSSASATIRPSPS